MPKPSLGILTLSNHNSSRSAAASPIMMQTCTWESKSAGFRIGPHSKA